MRKTARNGPSPLREGCRTSGQSAGWRENRGWGEPSCGGTRLTSNERGPGLSFLWRLSVVACAGRSPKIDRPGNRAKLYRLFIDAWLAVSGIIPRDLNFSASGPTYESATRSEIVDGPLGSRYQTRLTFPSVGVRNCRRPVSLSNTQPPVVAQGRDLSPGPSRDGGSSRLPLPRGALPLGDRM